MTFIQIKKQLSEEDDEVNFALKEPNLTHKDFVILNERKKELARRFHALITIWEIYFPEDYEIQVGNSFVHGFTSEEERAKRQLDFNLELQDRIKFKKEQEEARLKTLL